MRWDMSTNMVLVGRCVLGIATMHHQENFNSIPFGVYSTSSKPSNTVLNDCNSTTWISCNVSNFDDPITF